MTHHTAKNPDEEQPPVCFECGEEIARDYVTPPSKDGDSYYKYHVECAPEAWL